MELSLSNPTDEKQRNTLQQDSLVPINVFFKSGHLQLFPQNCVFIYTEIRFIAFLQKKSLNRNS